jgi:hypothetical protein
MVEDIKKILWATAHKLGSDTDVIDIVLGLVTLEFISETFRLHRNELTHHTAQVMQMPYPRPRWFGYGLPTLSFGRHARD